MSFEEQVAVITGGGRGLGRDLCIAFARSGAKVALIGRTAEPLMETKQEIESFGGEAFAVQADVAEEASVRACADKVLGHFGRVDILVNNAAIGGPSAPLWEVPLLEWQQTFDINTTGPFLCCKAFLPSMISRKSGSIVLIGSMTGKRQLLNRTAYAGSKLALVGMARTLAWETGPYGIRVNVVSPGPMEGERMKWVLESQAQDQGITIEDARNNLTSASPLGQFVPTKHVVEATLHLASERAGSTTGEDVNVSAGICMI